MNKRTESNKVINWAWKIHFSETRKDKVTLHADQNTVYIWIENEVGGQSIKQQLKFNANDFQLYLTHLRFIHNIIGRDNNGWFNWIDDEREKCLQDPIDNAPMDKA